MSSLDALLPLHARTQIGLRRMLVGLPRGSKIAAERDLSNQFGVSRVTIRRVLRDLAKEGVLDIRHGSGTYLLEPVVSTPESSDRSRLTTVIGLSVPSVESRWVARVAVGVEREAMKRDFGVMLSHDHNDWDLQARQLEAFRDRGCSGLIVYLTYVTAPNGEIAVNTRHADVLQGFIAAGLPVVLLDRYLPSIDASSVVTDMFKGMYAATEHLIAAGRRRFALLRFGPSAGQSDTDRNRGFRAALLDYGLNPADVIEASLGVCEHDVSARRVVADWWAERPGAFDAVVCMQDDMAFGAYLALKDAKAHVPDDVALVGWDNSDQPRYREVGLRLTSVDHPAEQMGERAVELVLENQTERRSKHVVLQPRLIVRGSCGVH